MLRICQLVDGMPLAIELAAAITRYMPLHDIAEQIERDTQVLQVDLRNVPVRHRSVPGLMNESFRLLTVDQMRALLSLSVFEGSFSAEAALTVADAPVRVISALVDQSLVQPREGRFSLHPLLRQFCRERLEDSWGEMKNRHAAYFAGFLAARRTGLERRQQAVTMRAIDPEFANIVAAWRWSVERERFDLLESSVVPLSLYLQYRARFLELAELLSAATPVVERAGQQWWRLLADLQMFHAWALMRIGRGAEALPFVKHASELYAENEEQCLAGLGRDPKAAMAMILWTAGDYESALAQAHASAEEARAKADTLGEAFGLYFAGGLALRLVEVGCTLGERSGTTFFTAPGSIEAVQRAHQMVKRASDILESEGERWLLARVTSELVRSIHLDGDARTAVQLLHQGLAMAEEFDDAATMASILKNLADFHLDYEELERAEPFIVRAQALSRHLGDKGGTSEVERNLARLHLARGQWELAAAHALTSIRLSQDVGFTNNIIANFRTVAIVLEHAGARENALELLRYSVHHPSTTPYSRATARAELERMGAAEGPGETFAGITPDEMADRARKWLAKEGVALLASGI